MNCESCEQETKADAPIEIGAVTRRWLEIWAWSAAAAKGIRSEGEREMLFRRVMEDRELIDAEIDERLAVVRECIATQQYPRHHARLVGFSNKLVDAFYDLGCAALFDATGTQAKECEWSRSEMAA